MSRRISRSKKHAIISTILSFILMLCIIGLSFFGSGTYSMLSKHALIHCCDRIEYYSSINKEMTTIAKEKGIPYGINIVTESEEEAGAETETEEVIDIFDDAKIKSDMELIIDAQLKGEEYTLSTEDISKNINAIAVAQFGTLNAEQQSSLDVYISEITEMYVSKMKIEGSDQFIPLIKIWRRIIIAGIPVLVFIAVICIFFMISMRSAFYRGLRYITYSVLGAGGTLTLVFAAGISDGFVYKFNISDVYMRKFYTYWIGHEMLMQVFVGIGLLLAGLVLMYVVFRQKNK